MAAADIERCDRHSLREKTESENCRRSAGQPEPAEMFYEKTESHE
jgi:hypothetical protein